MEQFERSVDAVIASPILGQGLGYIYSNMDSRNSESTVLENSYLTILVSTGILGFLFYSFIYLFYPIKYIISRNYDSVATTIMLSQVAIMLSALGNPYLFSGGVGLIFVVILAAIMNNQKNKDNEADESRDNNCNLEFTKVC